MTSYATSACFDFFFFSLFILLLNLLFSKPQSQHESTICDFEGATWHIFTPDPNTLLISLNLSCFGQLQRYGALEFIKPIYGPLLVQPEQGYNVSCRVVVNSPPPNGS